ncbi:MAG: hypothetical protein K6E55_10685 [Thermoguttaceae bacterium]|nr:hypothetical protein [Thermoguttaceae bacterium]
MTERPTGANAPAIPAGENKSPAAARGPAAYAYYQEHGYVVQASKVKRPIAGKVKGKGKKARYRRTEGKHFFRAAADQYFPKLRAEIQRINQETKLKLES